VLSAQSKTRSSFLLLNWRKKSNFFELAVLRSDSMKQNYGALSLTFVFVLKRSLIPVFKFQKTGDQNIKMVKHLFENLPRFRSWDCPLAVAMRTSSKFDKGDPVNFAKSKHYESGYL
jgi:hypothetical protein